MQIKVCIPQWHSVGHDNSLSSQNCSSSPRGQLCFLLQTVPMWMHFFTNPLHLYICLHVYSEQIEFSSVPLGQSQTLSQTCSHGMQYWFGHLNIMLHWKSVQFSKWPPFLQGTRSVLLKTLWIHKSEGERHFEWPRKQGNWFWFWQDSSILFFKRAFKIGLSAANSPQSLYKSFKWDESISLLSQSNLKDLNILSATRPFFTLFSDISMLMCNNFLSLNNFLNAAFKLEWFEMWHNGRTSSESQSVIPSQTLLVDKKMPFPHSKIFRPTKTFSTGFEQIW